jgi:hypothetical protein
MNQSYYRTPSQPQRRNLPPIQRPQRQSSAPMPHRQPHPLDRVLFYAVVFATIYSLSSLLVYFLGYFLLPALLVNAVPLGLAVTLMAELLFIAVGLRQAQKE